MRLEAPRRVVGFCLSQSTAPRPRDSRSSSSAALVSGEEGGTFQHAPWSKIEILLHNIFFLFYLFVSILEKLAGMPPRADQ